jgi:hypothetical protein
MLILDGIFLYVTIRSSGFAKANIVQMGILHDNRFRLELPNYQKEDQMASICASR